MNNIEKKYLEQSENFREIQNKIFLEALEKISKEKNIEINNLVFSEIKDDLNEKLPFISEKLHKFLFDFFKNIDIQDEKINKIINKKTKYSLLKPDFLEKKSTLFEFIKTANSFGIGNKYINKSSDLENLSDEDFSKKNFEKNYKNYIGEKLLFSSKEIKKQSIAELDGKFFKYISLATKHIYTIYSKINGNSEKFQSEYFPDIHSSETIFDLFKKYYELENKIGIIKDKNDFKENPEKYENELKQIKMGKFEIQRIFAISSLYINKDATLSTQHEKEEGDFLISKLVNLGTKQAKASFLSSGLKTKNSLHNYTIKKDFFWKKDENGKYIFSEEEKKGYEKVQFNSFELEGKERNYQKNKQKINILHMQGRVAKNPFSTIEKFLRKEHTSLKEILDEKGFMFVVENYNEGKKLLKIIENELGTLRTSWVEEPVFMSENGNKNSNSEYNSLKGIIKISYKSKTINKFFDAIEKIPGIRKMENLFPLFKDLKDKFYNKKYFIESEIQIFDIENYLKAEIDKTSPAYHGDYKERQQINNIPLYFPKEIYGEENLEKVIKKSLKKLENQQ
ncbi:hypothetical protein LR002_01725 [Candidatus Gracilibacteria bacterium]|nr:hypothetical protein [Candidatus Gracilibacteria bacterium]